MTGGGRRVGRSRADEPAVRSDPTDAATLTDPLVADALATVRRWLTAAADARADPAARRLADLLADPAGLAFTVDFVDAVLRPDDDGVAAAGLRRLARHAPDFLPPHLRLALVAGGALGPLAPALVVPVARAALRALVAHLVVDADPRHLGRTLARLRSGGARLNLNLLGEAVLGDGEADRRLAGVRALVARPDVDHVSVKVSAVVAQLSDWAFEESVERVVARLLPLAEQAAATGTFVTLDMEEYRDLDLTLTAFMRLLDHPQLHGLSAGIALQAYLPDAAGALDRLTAWALERRAVGGAPVKVRLVKGANLAMEQVHAQLHGWPQAPLTSKRSTDTHYLRLLRTALTPERVDAVHVGVAGHNLFDIAYAWHLARERGVSDRVEFEMLLGMAAGQAAAVRQDVGDLLLYTPVVPRHQFDAALAYLVRRLEENAADENFLSRVFALADDDGAFAVERDRFVASVAALAAEDPPARRRTQDRSTQLPPSPPGARFAGEPDTDPSLPANRAWARAVLARVPGSVLGVAAAADARLTSTGQVDHVVARVAGAADAWAARPRAERAAVLHAAGAALAASRADLLEVMAAETGKTLAEGDPEVSEAVDFAHWYAATSLGLDRVDGARFVPPRVVLVTPPWNFPVSIPAGGALAGLAAGGGVVLKPAPQARRCAAMVAACLWAAGVPRDLFALVDVDEDEVGAHLVAHPQVDVVVLTGSLDTARLFTRLRPERRVLAETSGKNAIVVTGSADLDLAVADLVTSAFAHAGQKCSAASLAILVGPVATSVRFRRQLLDAVASLRVGWPHDAGTVMGPLVEPPSGKLAAALAGPDPGEHWLLAPRRLDGSGRLWSPGIRDGVLGGSAFHTTEYFGPVLGLLRARTLAHAIDLQNGTPYGLTAGLHSLDPAEIRRWLAGVRAGNLYVNRTITGAIVGRQPFGGWAGSSVGPGAKAGGPHYVAALGGWRPAPLAAAPDLTLCPRVTRLLAGTDLPADESAWLAAAALDDERAWRSTFSGAHELAHLPVQRNVLRYRPATVLVRGGPHARPVEVLRVLAAAARAGAAVELSAARRGLGPAATVEDDEEFVARVARLAPVRVRLIGSDRGALAHALADRVDVPVWADPVTSAGAVELLAFMREQSVSVTCHRYGTVQPRLAATVPTARPAERAGA